MSEQFFPFFRGAQIFHYSFIYSLSRFVTALHICVFFLLLIDGRVQVCGPNLKSKGKMGGHQVLLTPALARSLFGRTPPSSTHWLALTDHEEQRLLGLLAR